MGKTIQQVATLILMTATIMLAGCGSTLNSPNVTGVGASGTTVDGAALYAANCAACHGALANSAKTGATLALIQTGISSNLGGMGTFSSLSTEQVQAISNALNGIPVTTVATTPSTPAPAPSTTPTPTPTPVDGAALYAANCAGCHGALASSAKLGATAALIQTGISSVGAMSSLASLSAPQVQAIATALAPAATPTPTPVPAPAPAPTPAPTPAPIDGAALYASNCASCHGALASSGKLGASVAQIQTGISSVGAMSSLASLSAAQVQAISSALAPAAAPVPTPAPAPTPTPVPIDGAALYASNCASCHGALASSTKRKATVAQIQTGISSVGGMRSLSTLTAAQVQAISTALNF